jgi:hypothetical protein
MNILTGYSGTYELQNMRFIKLFAHFVSLLTMWTDYKAYLS